MKTATETHTPTPWSNERGEIYAESRYVAKVYDWSNPDCAPQYEDINRKLWAEFEANAAFIVRACNAHDDLVAACESLIRAESMQRGARDGCTMGEISQAIDLARAALAKAKGGAS